MIEINGLKKTYNGKCTLDVDYVRFEPGRCYILLGENGSGKSTLLRILAGVIMQDAGSIVYGGGFGADVAYMPQKPYAFRMPVWKSVLLGGKVEGGGRKYAEKILGEMGISRLINQTEAKLSGGEAQRVAFARVMKRRSGILLLDEPTSAMDKEGTLLSEALLKKYMGENKSVLIMATHSAKQAARLGDEAVLMREGKVVLNGAIGEVLAERNRQFEECD